MLGRIGRDALGRVARATDLGSDAWRCVDDWARALTARQRWVIAIISKIQLPNTLPIILNCVIGIIN